MKHPEASLILFLLLLLGGIVYFGREPVEPATCKGARPCKACSDCTKCRYCHVEGGYCGVCSKPAIPD